MPLLPPELDFGQLKNLVMEVLKITTYNSVLGCRDFIGGNNLNHFEYFFPVLCLYLCIFRPILKLFDNLLLIGLITDEDIIALLNLIHPLSFGDPQNPLSQDGRIRPNKGLCDIELANFYLFNKEYNFRTRKIKCHYNISAWLKTSVTNFGKIWSFVFLGDKQ